MFVGASLLARFRQATGTRWTKSPTNSPWPRRPRIRANGCHGSHGFSSTKTLFPRVAIYHYIAPTWFAVSMSLNAMIPSLIPSLILHPGFQLQGVELQLFATLIQATEVQPASTCCPKFLRFLSYVCPRVVAALFAKTSWSSMWIWSCQQFAVSGGLLWKAPPILTVSYFLQS